MGMTDFIGETKLLSRKAFGKHSGTIVHGQEPFNAGPPPSLLGRERVTPVDLFFVRNHGNVPAVDIASYRLALRGLTKQPLSFSLSELQSKFPRVTVPAVLQCAGLRRCELHRLRPIPNEVNWGAEPVGAAIWSGVRLRDVLEAAGIDSETKHIAFTGLDHVERHGESFGFGGSIPLEKALGSEVLLAYAMNGRPLEPAHGYPLRLVVPGYIGARSIKWLKEICFQAEPSSNYFQASAYKVFPPDVTALTADWNSVPALTEFPTNSAICEPHDGATLAAGEVRICGYAFAQRDRQIETVHVIVNDGSPVAARLITPPRPWTWRLWEATLSLKSGAHHIAAMATDSSGYTQPADMASLWNFKGYLNNAWHRIGIHVR